MPFPTWSSSALTPWAAPSATRISVPPPGLFELAGAVLISSAKAIIAMSTQGYRQAIGATPAALRILLRSEPQREDVMTDERTATEMAVEMVACLDQLPEDQGREHARAMIAAAGMYLQQHFGETVTIDTVSSIMTHFVCAEILKRHEASPAGVH